MGSYGGNVRILGTLKDYSPPGSSVYCGIFPGKNTVMGSHSLLQGIFPTQGSNPCLLHCRRIPSPSEFTIPCPCASAHLLPLGRSPAPTGFPSVQPPCLLLALEPHPQETCPKTQFKVQPSSPTVLPPISGGCCTSCSTHPLLGYTACFYYTFFPAPPPLECTLRSGI